MISYAPVPDGVSTSENRNWINGRSSRSGRTNQSEMRLPMTKDKLKRKLRKLRTRTKLEISDLLIERDKLIYNQLFIERENDLLRGEVAFLKGQAASAEVPPSKRTQATFYETANGGVVLKDTISK